MPPLVHIEPDILPLTYDDVKRIVKEKRPDILFNARFNSAMKRVKVDEKLCKPNFLNPRTKLGGKKDFYANGAVDALIKFYDEEASS